MRSHTAREWGRRAPPWRPLPPLLPPALPRARRAFRKCAAWPLFAAAASPSGAVVPDAASGGRADMDAAWRASAAWA